MNFSEAGAVLFSSFHQSINSRKARFRSVLVTHVTQAPRTGQIKEQFSKHVHALTHSFCPKKLKEGARLSPEAKVVMEVNLVQLSILRACPGHSRYPGVSPLLTYHEAWHHSQDIYQIWVVLIDICIRVFVLGGRRWGQVSFPHIDTPLSWLKRGL